MFCKHCGSQIADDAIFCSNCGTRLVEDGPAAPASETHRDIPDAATQPLYGTAPAPGVAGQTAINAAKVPAEPEAPAKPFLEGMEWNVSEYPDSNATVKTEDIDFDWGMDPVEVPELRAREPEIEPPAPTEVSVPRTPEAETVSQIFDRVVPAEEAKASIPVKEALEAANKVEEVGQFNTFNRKNAEFQQLLNREYEKVRGAGTIGDEQVKADEAAHRKYEERKEEVTMDDFLQQEGVVKPYEPKKLESDVLDRIEALEKQKARKEAEEAARIKALEEARLEALAQKRAQEEQMNAEIEARAAAEAEIREAEEAEALRLKIEEERRRAAEDAARLEAIANRKAQEEARAQEEMRLRAAEEARAKAEAEARAKAEEEARLQAEAEAKAAAEERARLQAEAELKAAQEAARIRAQREAALAAREEAEFKAAQERRRREEEIARLKKEAEEKQRARTEETAVVEDEVRKALEQTARMRQEEEDKIKAALAGIRGGRFSDTLSSTEKALPDEKPSIKDTLQGKKTTEGPVELPVEHIETVTPEAPQIDVHGDTVTPATTEFTPRDKIEEAHRHTRYNIEGMAKAREDFFADLPGGDPEGEKTAAATNADGGRQSIVSPLTRTVDKEAIAAGISSTKKLSREDFDLSGAIGTEPSVVPAAPAVEPAAPVFEPEVSAVEPVPEPIDVEKEAQTPEDLLSQFASVMDREADAGSEAPVVGTIPEVPVAAEPQAEPVYVEPQADPIFVEPQAAPVIPEPQAASAPFEAPAGIPIEEVAPVVPVEQVPVQTEKPVFDPALEALKAEKPGLEDTMIMPQIGRIDEMTSSDLQGYTDADPQELLRLKEAAIRQEAESQERTAAAAAEIATTGVSTGEALNILEQIEQDAQKIQQETETVAQDDQSQTEAPLTAKELKKQERAKAKEAKKAAREKKKEEKRKKKEDMISADDSDIVEAGAEAGEATGEEEQAGGGKGRLILMIILILLCVIFALELVGIGIKMFASTSAAAEFIDSILNKLIQMITGSGIGGSGTA